MNENEIYLSKQIIPDIFDDRFRHMILRRGYTLDVCKDEHGCFARVWTGGGWMLDHWRFEYESLLDLVRRLEQFVGQEHVACTCGIPYYRKVAGEGLTHWYEYRAIADGPDSEPLVQCHFCEARLDESVRPITDRTGN